MTTILVIEDDEDLRAVVVQGLVASDRTLLEADDGLAALAVIEAQGLPDLILLDMNIPGMNGWQFAQELQARGLWHVPVVVITAAHDAARSAHEIGATDYLGKPFELRALRSLVEKLLARTKAAVSA